MTFLKPAVFHMVKKNGPHKPFKGFVFSVLVAIASQTAYSKESIILPDAVVPITPAPAKTIKKIKPKPKDTAPSPASIRDQELKELSSGEFGGKIVMGLNWLIPSISVTGDREKYKVDPTTHFYSYYRFSEKLEEFNFVYGLRVASFSGSGLYKSVPGQFGWLYTGPAMGIFYLTPKEFTPRGARTQAPEFTTNTIHFLHFGIAAQTRRGSLFANDETVNDDLTTTVGVNYDSPGIWLEYQYQIIYFNGIGLGATIGSQLGNGKVMSWLGISTSGWY